VSWASLWGKGKSNLAGKQSLDVKMCRIALRVNVNVKVGKGSILDLTGNQPAGWASRPLMKGKLYLALLEPSEVKRCRSALRVNINDKDGKGSLLDLTENQPAGWASLLWKGKLNLACDEPSEVKRCRRALRVNINDLDSQGLLLEDLTGNQLEGWAISFRERRVKSGVRGGAIGRTAERTDEGQYERQGRSGFVTGPDGGGKPICELGKPYWKRQDRPDVR
jgi:hypothetical protein